MEWISTLWNEGFWYDKLYLTSAIVFIVFFVLSLIVMIPYLNVASEVEKEYKTLYSNHFFMSFRTKKQRELYQRAEYRVRRNNRQYPFYILKKFFSFTSITSLGIAFWFFIGSYAYENVIGIPLNDNSRTITTDYEDVDIETYDDDDNIHHVDPHWVDGYERNDGTEVEGYWRGGEDGYDRNDPDGDSSNNLDSDDSSVDDYNSIGETVEDWSEGVIDSFFGN